MTRFSLIVPAPSISEGPAMLKDLQSLGRQGRLEILVATGSNPSRQRNLAAGKARGDWLVFLDSDCRVAASYFDRLSGHAERGLEIVGGPVLLPANATSSERTFQRLLSHPFLAGPSSSRYRSHGVLRECDDAELILCNLAVRRDRFLKSPGFDERLYPNEENEWLARARANGARCWHDPELIVRRPQRKSWLAYARMVVRYGRGRTRQFVVSGVWDGARQFPAVALLVWLFFLVLKPRFAAMALLSFWTGLGVACLASPDQPGGPRLPIRAALLAPSVPLLYALGQLAEFLRPGPRSPAGEILVYRWEPKLGIFVSAP